MLKGSSEQVFRFDNFKKLVSPYINKIVLGRLAAAPKNVTALNKKYLDTYILAFRDQMGP